MKVNPAENRVVFFLTTTERLWTPTAKLATVIVAEVCPGTTVPSRYQAYESTVAEGVAVMVKLVLGARVVGGIVVKPTVTVTGLFTVIPPVPTLSVHWAYTVVSAVTVSLAKTQAVDNPDSLYQPAKVYPALVGSVGLVASAPLTSPERAVTALPPLLLKLNV